MSAINRVPHKVLMPFGTFVERMVYESNMNWFEKSFEIWKFHVIQRKSISFYLLLFQQRNDHSNRLDPVGYVYSIALISCRCLYRKFHQIQFVVVSKLHVIFDEPSQAYQMEQMPKPSNSSRWVSRNSSKRISDWDGRNVANASTLVNTINSFHRQNLALRLGMFDENPIRFTLWLLLWFHSL